VNSPAAVRQGAFVSLSPLLSASPAIHLLSILTLATLPAGVWHARRHAVRH
jgi:uncharacterized membrane protein